MLNRPAKNTGARITAKVKEYWNMARYRPRRSSGAAALANALDTGLWISSAAL